MTLARTGVALNIVVLGLTGAVSGWQNRAWPPPVQKVSNDSPTLTPDDVKEVRDMTASRTRPWTEDEISRLTGRGGGRGRGGQ